ncbi:GNAT family N-acetyltransferase [Sphingomonas sp. SRS2]|uniref:GNAT family N-acetyltransferase n=1 Tax=Sphingomonas sp. SRS2 TaxID=133190 RepID=UPI0006184B48|nr:GNAT family N-acetyltransferase [Sphingomonas sp. SRS2]KKC27678.1 GCN5 family acetyltransferase [Sphingomonas sp. SRS2]
MGGALAVRSARRDDAAAIAAIYAHYVRNSVITFELDPPDAATMAVRMDSILPLYPYLVTECDGVLLGYAYAGRLYDRAAYRWTAEATVYVAHEWHRRGIGHMLYAALIAALAAQGFQSVVGKITLPNPASTLLHEACGFRQVGLLAKVGYKQDAWHDVGIYQLELGTRPVGPEEPRPFLA